ncbi:hypothetical protein TNCV_884601 [Trichonephila clavipes]|nr:hypothetical protein TNCV_884601 [Trichonephila clavipes]
MTSDETSHISHVASKYNNKTINQSLTRNSWQRHLRGYGHRLVYHEFKPSAAEARYEVPLCRRAYVSKICRSSYSPSDGEVWRKGASSVCEKYVENIWALQTKQVSSLAGTPIDVRIFKSEMKRKIRKFPAHERVPDKFS